MQSNRSISRNCAYCTRLFVPDSRSVRRGMGHYCSQKCYGLSRLAKTGETFWARVEKSNGCYEWQGAVTPIGYGSVRRWGHTMPAHRVAWTLTYGPIPPGIKVLHKCDNRRCCRPDHLFLGSQIDNIHDMIAKGRAVYPAPRNGKTKLTDAQAIHIRSLYKSKQITQDQLALDFGVSQSVISRIVNPRSHLSVPQ